MIFCCKLLPEILCFDPLLSEDAINCYFIKEAFIIMLLTVVSLGWVGSSMEEHLLPTSHLTGGCLFSPFAKIYITP